MLRVRVDDVDVGLTCGCFDGYSDVGNGMIFIGVGASGIMFVGSVDEVRSSVPEATILDGIVVVVVAGVARLALLGKVDGNGFALQSTPYSIDARPTPAWRFVTNEDLLVIQSI